ncbi:MAG: right-handed parallel beta-helix repeat-containing protein [Candidatus Lokiarchaeota archaeon]|nr:right-handed parallel beta-helix repeat-containing protein [Candidatus Lokiarchaeota archaeon]
MKPKANSKIGIIYVLGIFFVFSPLITTNIILKTEISKSDSEYDNYININYENMKTSAVSGEIHIIGNSGWTDFKNEGNCSGEGTFSEPYIIQDLMITAKNMRYGILIENSSVYFRIENCTIYDLIGSQNTGIKLINITNSQLIDNNLDSNLCGIYLFNSTSTIISGNILNDNSFGIDLTSSNNNTLSENTINLGSNGIDLYNSDNNNISGNTFNYNDFRGIHLFDSDNNTISGNTVYGNWFGIWAHGSDNYISRNTLNSNHLGIHLYNCRNFTLTGNIMNESGLGISGNLEMFTSFTIDTTNLVNGKPIYYYVNEINLGPDNFTNAGQVILVNCNESLISNLNIFNSYRGISLNYCNNNSIMGNTANYNAHGIHISNSNYNTISGNSINFCIDGICLYSSGYNIISGNTVNNSSNNGYGISLYSSNGNTISGNSVNNNVCGIYLFNSDYNFVSKNSILGNNECILEDNCEGNELNDNICPHSQTDNSIPGLNLFFLLCIVSVTLIILSKKVKKSFPPKYKYHLK